MKQKNNFCSFDSPKSHRNLNEFQSSHFLQIQANNPSGAKTRKQQFHVLDSESDGGFSRFVANEIHSSPFPRILNKKFKRKSTNVSIRRKSKNGYNNSRRKTSVESSFAKSGGDRSIRNLPRSRKVALWVNL